MSQRIAFVTSNPGKIATAAEHLRPLGIDVEQVQLDLDEIQSTSVQQVALHKARQAFQILRRPVVVEDSGFYLDELGFPGPLVKYLVNAVGAEGVARLADQTVTRRAHFEGVLVYIDARGVSRVFTDSGDGGTIAGKATTEPQPGAWSALWDVFIPNGCDQSLSALREQERARVFDGVGPDPVVNLWALPNLPHLAALLQPHLDQEQRHLVTLAARAYLSVDHGWRCACASRAGQDFLGSAPFAMVLERATAWALLADLMRGGSRRAVRVGPALPAG